MRISISTSNSMSVRISISISNSINIRIGISTRNSTGTGIRISFVLRIRISNSGCTGIGSSRAY